MYIVYFLCKICSNTAEIWAFEPSSVHLFILCIHNLFRKDSGSELHGRLL